MDYIYNITEEEAKRRVDSEYLVAINMLDASSPQYMALDDNEKKVVYHLCRAAFWLDKVNYKLQNAHNLDFYHYVQAKANSGDEYSKNVLRLFLAQKSINSLDTNGDYINLAKGILDNPGKNFYHFDIPKEEFIAHVKDMADKGMWNDLSKILSARTVVDLVDGKLIATDYVEYFAEEFNNCATELINASKYCDDDKFQEYLIVQSKALQSADVNLDATADMLWAKLTGRLEFTITRESYEDELTTAVFADEKLAKQLADHGIEVNPKDSIGARIGIVNEDGTRLLNTLQSLNNIACNLMPYNSEYSMPEDNSNPDQVALDVDLITLTGDSGAYRAGIVLAENLPNSDKLAIQLGGGRRNIYHRQVRNTKPSDTYKKLIHPEYIKYFNIEASHWATIEHENTHSLGPKDIKALGEYANILEEYKADMGMYSFLRQYVAQGVFSDEQAKQIIVTELFASFLKAKPQLSQAHRVRSVMITNRLLIEGGIVFDNDVLSFNFDKVIDTCATMLSEVIRLQLDKSVAKAKAYVDKYFVWTDTHDKIANIIKANSKRLNGEVVAPIYNEATKDLNI